MPSAGALYRKAKVAADAALRLLAEQITSFMGLPEQRKDNPLAYWFDRIRIVEQVRLEVNNRLSSRVDLYVQNARAEGATWTDLSKVLGLTRQGVRRRFANTPPTPRTH